MSGSAYKGFVFLVVVLSFVVFPASEFSGLTDLFYGWLGIIFILFGVIGFAIMFVESVVPKLIEVFIKKKEEFK